MKEIYFHNRHCDVTLAIPQNMMDEMAEQAVSHFPDEFGGFLFGNYFNKGNHLQICKYRIPEIYKSSSTGFERYIDGITEFDNSIKIGQEPHYIGEWHSHPGGTSMYSQTDLSAMKRIAAFETVTIKNPVLLIISANKFKEIDYRFYLYHDGGLTAYEQN